MKKKLRYVSSFIFSATILLSCTTYAANFNIGGYDGNNWGTMVDVLQEKYKNQGDYIDLHQGQDFLSLAIPASEKLFDEPFDATLEILDGELQGYNLVIYDDKKTETSTLELGKRVSNNITSIAKVNPKVTTDAGITEYRWILPKETITLQISPEDYSLFLTGESKKMLQYVQMKNKPLYRKPRM